MVSKLTRGTCWKGFVSKTGLAEVEYFCRANLNFALVDGLDPYSRRYERLLSLDGAVNTSQLTVCHRIDGPDCRLMQLCCGIARYSLRCGVRLPNASISATVGISCQLLLFSSAMRFEGEYHAIDLTGKFDVVFCDYGLCLRTSMQQRLLDIGHH